MRFLFPLAAAAVTIAAAFSAATRADAQSAYPFCAIYAAKGGTPSCHFATREQCMADVSGLGGTCVENPSYRPAAATSPRRQTAAGRRRG
jgi:uncharacterized protein DUF3551